MMEEPIRLAKQVHRSTSYFFSKRKYLANKLFIPENRSFVSIFHAFSSTQAQIALFIWFSLVACSVRVNTHAGTRIFSVAVLTLWIEFPGNVKSTTSTVSLVSADLGPRRSRPLDFGPRRLRPASIAAQVFQAINIKIVAHTIMPMGRDRLGQDRRGYHKYMLISANIALKCYL